MTGIRIGMASPLQNIVDELKKLSPEDRALLGTMFGAGQVPTDPAAPAADIDPALLAEMEADMKKLYPRLDAERIKRLAVSNILRTKEIKKAKPPRAEPVYFFQQHALFVTEKIEADPDHPDGFKKTGYFLEPRVIAVDIKTASKMFWKRRREFGYIGRGTGVAWARARSHGMSIAEAQGVEFEEMKKNPDRTPPPNNDKTFLAGTKCASASMGRQIPWEQGLKQKGGE